MRTFLLSALNAAETMRIAISPHVTGATAVKLRTLLIIPGSSRTPVGMFARNPSYLSAATDVFSFATLVSTQVYETDVRTLDEEGK